MIVTTVVMTLATILRGQPRWLGRDYDVSLVTSPDAAFPDLVGREGVRGFTVPMVRGISPLRDLVAIARMVRVLRRERPDVIQSYTPKAGLVAMVAGWLARVPVRIHTFTGLLFPSRSGWSRRLLVWADRVISACATHVVAESRGVRAALEEARICAKPIEMIGAGNIAGIDTGHFDPDSPELVEAGKRLRADLGLKGSDFLFLYVGRLNADKGLDELLEAFGSLADSARLLVVGPLDETAPASSRVLATLERGERIHPLDHLDDVRPAYAAADALVLPSYREGFPNVLLEAAAMRVPLIATDISGCNELIEPGRNGWLVPARQAPPLAEAMRQAMDLPRERREAMGSEARARVQRDFERSAHVARLGAFYREKIGAGDVR